MAEPINLPTPVIESETSDSGYSYISEDSSDISDLSSPPASPQTPPGFYPSPPPSQGQEDERNLPSKSRARATSGAGSQEPARKKRRVGPTPRSTQHLDLSEAAEQQQAQIDLLVKTLRTRRKIVVIAGAGISTSAGIPDFRSSDGLFKSVQKKHNLKSSGKLLFDAAVYRDDSLTASFHEMVRTLSAEAARSSPTAFHHMLASIAQDNRLSRLYTQNIDCIESSMPPLETQVPLNSKAPWPRTIQLHGALDKMVCQKCRHLSDFDRQLFDGPDAPPCPACSETDAVRMTTGQRSHGVGKMRPRIVLYNEHNPDEEAIASVMNSDIRSRPDAVVVVGTSLKIPGVRRLVKSLCKVVRSRKNGVAMWINNEPPVGKEFEDCWDLMVKGDCDKVARLVSLKRWDDRFDECDSSEVERVKKEYGLISVVVETPTKKQKTFNTGILTPASSHDDDDSALSHEQRAKLISNPASKGKNLNDILAASKTSNKTNPAVKKGQTKATKKPRTAKGPKAQSTTIQAFTKVTKGAGTAPAGTGKTSKLERDDSSKLNPLPASTARNNAGVMFPNLVTKQDPDWSNQATISPPRDHTPRGMDGLLHLE